MKLYTLIKNRKPTLQRKIIFYMLLLAVLTITPFFVTFYNFQKTALLQGIDEKLRTAAIMAKNTLPNDYHDKIKNSKSVNSSEYFKIVERNNKLCKVLGLKYIWSLLKINNSIVFTTATSPDMKIGNNKHAAFFERHSNPDAYNQVFNNMKVTYKIIEDKWGKIRVVLVPYSDSLGRHYLFGACIRLTDVENKMQTILLTCILISIGILAGAICISLLLAQFIAIPIVQLTKTIEGLSEGNVKLIAEKQGTYEQIILAESFNKLNKNLHDKIAEYNISEKLLQENEARHCSMITNISEVIVIIDSNFIIKYVSPNITKNFGWLPSDLINTNSFLNVDPTDIKNLNDEINLLLERNNSSKSFTFRYKCKDNSYKPIELTAKNLINDPIINGILVNFRDITKRRAIELALLENEQRQRDMINNLPGFIYRCKNDQNWTMVFISEGCKAITGYSADDFLFNKKLAFNDIVRADYQNRLFNKVQESIKKKEPFQHNSYPIITASGETRYFWERGYGVYSENGELKYLEGFITDITESKLAEINLKKLSRAVEQSQVSIMITNKENIIEYVNPKFLEVSGYTYNEILGRNPSFLKSGVEIGKDDDEMGNILNSEKEWKCIFHNKKKNGEHYWESATISPVKNDLGETTHYVAVKEDITEKIEMEQNLHKALERAEEMNRLKTNFIANMNHEFRTPLNGILGFSALLSDELNEKDHLIMANAIYNSAKRLNATLNLILDLSNFESEKVDLTFKQIEVVETIKNVANLFYSSAIQKNLQFNIIAKQEFIYAELDDYYFPRVIHNLIDNALKYTEEGSITIEIGIKPEFDNNKFYINVIDTGIGISPEKINIIWEAFRQGSEGLNRSFEGTGLGLTIAKKITNLFKGNITVESTLGKGSIFTLELPRITSDLIVTSPLIKTPESYISIEIPRTLNFLPLVLYVEDDEINQSVVSQFLKNKYKLEKAMDATSALKLINKKKYDIILMDINLGIGMNGIQLTKEIRQNMIYKNVPIIAVTAYTTEAEKQEFFAAGCSHYLQKPFIKKDLIALLDSLFI